MLYGKKQKTLISAFVERWQLDTNTFHLPFGEMSITLEDVSTLLHISVMGKVVDCALYTVEAIKLVFMALDVMKAKAEMQLNKDLKLNELWLKGRWGKKPKSSKKGK
ncbi:hypothetical protein Scep_007397 [Stephania cephalantha]|uniref:Aminotransferase-like plant mobile domain-containing protein n=1 Tax=Stephania cephalantha TaxID=152367 RepID=A0AAP0KB27_9MAGN